MLDTVDALEKEGGRPWQSAGSKLASRMVQVACGIMLVAIDLDIGRARTSREAAIAGKGESGASWREKKPPVEGGEVDR